MSKTSDRQLEVLERCDAANKSKPAQGHTPGPWKDYTNYACAGTLKGSYVDAGSCRIATVHSLGVASQETCEANARLIAAAPALLATVKTLAGILRRLNLTTPDGEIIEGKYLLRIQDADQLIAKAEGRAQ